MSIYKKVLGDNFNRLHPMLQKRYDLKEGTIFKASGVMTKIQRGPKWLSPIFFIGIPFKLLFPESGKEIPFTIKNTAFVAMNGEQQVHWERVFHFDKKKRYFNALMSLDAERLVIKDYLGEPAPIYSDLAFSVSNEGMLLITSLRQRLVLGKIELPLPKVFQGLATVTEFYNDKTAKYEISVSVRNPLTGILFAYEGTFIADV